MEGKGTTAGLAASSVRLGRGRPGLKWARRPTRGLKLFCGVPTSSVHVGSCFLRSGRPQGQFVRSSVRGYSTRIFNFFTN
jgi:hypothetical protein